MDAVMTAAGTMFSALFGSTGYIKQVITLVTGNDFLLIGLSCMVCGFVLSIIRKLIAST